MNIPHSITYWSHFVTVALFSLGLLGLLIRKNSIVALMCIELMLNAVNLLLVETSMRSGTADGIIMVVFIVTVAAAEVAVGLGIILNLYRFKGTINLDQFKKLQG